MAGTTQPPLAVAGWLNTQAGMDWLLRFQQGLMGVASLTEQQTFSAKNTFKSGGDVINGNITLAANRDPVVDIQKVSHNATYAGGLGGTAGLYVQHQVDNSVASASLVNTGIRVQLETFQQNGAGLTNDCVAGYFGLFNGGVNTGGFGYHVDAYHAATGTGCTTYGGSAELRRSSAAGWTAGFHARCISASNYYDNDYGFLCSPGGPNSNVVAGGPRQTGYMSAFSVGSLQTGTMRCAFGLDMRFAQVTDSGIYMLDNVNLAWGDNVESHKRQLSAGAPGQFSFQLNGSNILSITDAGLLSFTAGAIFSTANAASGKYLEILIPGIGAQKIQLLAP